MISQGFHDQSRFLWSVKDSLISPWFLDQSMVLWSVKDSLISQGFFDQSRILWSVNDLWQVNDSLISHNSLISHGCFDQSMIFLSVNDFRNYFKGPFNKTKIVTCFTGHKGIEFLPQTPIFKSLYFWNLKF